jgi:2-haloacid dehalogenase
MRKYDTILLDVDDTLLDFSACERAAFSLTMAQLQIPCDETMIRRYSEINRTWWDRFERGEIEKQEIMAGRYVQLAEEYHLALDPMQTGRLYAAFLSRQHVPMPDMHFALEYLARRYRLYLATNATAAVQNSRLQESGILPYVQDCFYSETAGAQKPEKAFFDYCFTRIPDFSPARTLMLGDSLQTDILGASRAGIDACWMNAKHLPRPAALPIALEIHALRELPEVL